MTSSDASSAAQWGKLTSLNPGFENISLSKNSAIFAVSNGGFHECLDESPLKTWSIFLVRARGS